MSNTTGSQRYSTTVLMAVEMENLLDLYIKFVNTGHGIRLGSSSSIAGILTQENFRRYISKWSQIQPLYINGLNVEADEHRVEKIRLFRSITSFTEALEATDVDDDGLLSSFRDRLNQSKTRPFEIFEHRIENLFSLYTQSIIANLGNAELLSVFDERNTVEKIQFLNTITGALSYTEEGTDFIKESLTLSGQLLDEDRINEIINAIGVTVEEDADGTPILSFTDDADGHLFRSDVDVSLPSTNTAPIVSAFTLLSYFAKDVIPAVWMSLLHRSTTENGPLLRNEAENIIDRTFELLLPQSAIDSFSQASTEQELLSEIEDFKTKLGSVVGLAFDALTMIAGVKSSFVLARSAVNNDTATAEDFKNALSAVNVINSRIASGLKNGSNREKMSKTIGYRIGYITLGIDIYIGFRNIRYAAIYGENMVIVGNLLVVSGSAIPVALGIAVRVGLVVGGPKVWIAGIVASTLSLVGGALISRGTRNAYEQFADYCYFGTRGIHNATGNSEPDHVAYNFDHADTRIALQEQNNRMQTLINPLGFGFRRNNTAIIIKYEPMRTIDGDEVRWLPTSVISSFDVGLVENGGSREGFATNNEMAHFINTGAISLGLNSQERQPFRNKWFQMTVNIGTGDDRTTLIEYSYYRRYFWEN